MRVNQRKDDLTEVAPRRGWPDNGGGNYESVAPMGPGGV